MLLVFLHYLALDVTENCICEIQCLALDGFDLNTVHKLSRRERKSWQSWDSKPGLPGGKQECFLCATQVPPPHYEVMIIIQPDRIELFNGFHFLP